MITQIKKLIKKIGAECRIMNRFFYYVTTTDPKDKEKIASYKAQGLNHIEAIKKLVREEND